MINVLIIDDEKKARDILRTLIVNFIPELNILGEAENAVQGRDMLEKLKPDIVFLDINMPDANGFTILSSFDEIHFDVIFTTAYSEYALKAIKYSALDYLLKPINLEDLKAAIEKYKTKNEQKATSEEEIQIGIIQEASSFAAGQTTKIILPIPKGFKIVSVSQIIYLMAAGSYTEFILDNGKKIVVSKNLKYFEENFSKFGLFRVHDSYMINLAHVDSYIRGRGGQVVMSNADVIDISREKKNTFLDKFVK